MAVLLFPVLVGDSRASCGSDGVVVFTPGFDQDLGLGQGVEDLPVQEFITHRAVKALVVAIFPRAARRDAERLHADLRQPLLHGIGDKFRPVV